MAVAGFSIGADHTIGALIPWHVRKPGERDFRAAIAYYGRCGGAAGGLPRNAMSVLQIVAEHDLKGCSAGCPNMARLSAGIVEMHVIPGAYHAFDSLEYSGRIDPAGNRMQYSAEATRQARDLTMAFLAKHLGPGRRPVAK